MTTGHGRDAYLLTHSPIQHGRQVSVRVAVVPAARRVAIARRRHRLHAIRKLAVSCTRKSAVSHTRKSHP